MDIQLVSVKNKALELLDTLVNGILILPIATTYGVQLVIYMLIYTIFKYILRLNIEKTKALSLALGIVINILGFTLILHQSGYSYESLLEMVDYMNNSSELSKMLLSLMIFGFMFLNFHMNNMIMINSPPEINMPAMPIRRLRRAGGSRLDVEKNIKVLIRTFNNVSNQIKGISLFPLESLNVSLKEMTHYLKLNKNNKIKALGMNFNHSKSKKHIRRTNRSKKRRVKISKN
jgi:hypothetical protein